MNFLNMFRNDYFLIKDLIKDKKLSLEDKSTINQYIKSKQYTLNHNIKTLKEELKELEDSLQVLEELKKEIEEKESK